MCTVGWNRTKTWVHQPGSSMKIRTANKQTNKNGCCIKWTSITVYTFFTVFLIEFLFFTWLIFFFFYHLYQRSYFIFKYNFVTTLFHQSCTFKHSSGIPLVNMGVSQLSLTTLLPICTFNFHHRELRGECPHNTILRNHIVSYI